MNGDGIIGLRLNADGTSEPIFHPDQIDTISADISGRPGLVLVDQREQRPGTQLAMHVDDSGLDRPVNLAATRLYGTGWPITGDAVLIDQTGSPLPQLLLTELYDPAHDHPGTRRAPRSDPEPLDWDDHLDARDRDFYVDPTGDDDLDVAKLSLHPVDENLLDRLDRERSVNAERGDPDHTRHDTTSGNPAAVKSVGTVDPTTDLDDHLGLDSDDYDYGIDL